jgi:hypothetical protein
VFESPALDHIALSFNGRTLGPEPNYGGSSPPGATRKEVSYCMWLVLLLLLIILLGGGGFIIHAGANLLFLLLLVTVVLMIAGAGYPRYRDW